MCKKTDYCLQASFLLLLSLLNISQVFAEEGVEYRFERLWPQLEQPWYFNFPSDIAVAPDGSVYIVDTYNDRIQQYSTEGHFIRTWGSRGAEQGQFKSPRGIAIASNGNVYIADSENRRIQQFSAEGIFIRTWGSIGFENGQFRDPRGLAIASNGNVYVTDFDNSRVQQFSPEGHFIKTWGHQGSADGQFDHPKELIITSNDNVYIADTWNNRIQQFNAEGRFIRSWGHSGSVEEQLVSPAALAVALDGSIYVIDDKGIHQFTVDGNIIGHWRNPNVLNPFGDHQNIAISTDGNIYISDNVNNRIQQFDSERKLVQEWGANNSKNSYFNTPGSIAIASSNSIYVVDSRNYRIQQFSSEGNFIQTWGSRGSGNGQFEYPHSIAVGPNSNVYITDSFNDRVQIFSTDGNFVKTWGSTGSGNGQFDTVSGLDVASNGDVYVIDKNNSRIQQFDSSGVFIRTWGNKGSGKGQFDSPSGLALSPDGSVYVADLLNNRIQQFSARGDFIRTWGRKGSEDGEFSQPKGLAITPDGSVYVADTKNHRIQKFSANGGFIQSWGSKGSGNGQFYEPADLAFAGDGSVYIVDSKNHRIQKSAPKIKTVNSAHPYKAIILAGGGEKFASGRSNAIWSGTWRITQKAYKALTSQAFKAHEEIKFLTAGNTQLDLDLNSKLDDLEAATKNNLRIAITEWASDATDVVIYLSNHGGSGKFKINGAETLTSEELNDWVSQLEQHIPGKVTIIIEACNSASFFTQLSRPGRFLLASAKADQNAVISNDGLTSFSYTFWSEIATGTTVNSAFRDARQAMSKITFANDAQNAQAEIDGNNIFNLHDLEKLGDYCLGECNKVAGAAPEINPFSPASQTLNGNTTSDFSVTIESLLPLNRVWAIVQRPDDISIDTNQPLNFEKISLRCNAQDQCQGQYNRFDLKGEYRLSVFALDAQGGVSFPETLTVTQLQGAEVYPVQYNDDLTTVYLRDVEYRGQHYRAALELKGDKFVLIAADLALGVFNPAAKFDSVSDLLTVPLALVSGKLYQARFKHLGNFEFKLEAATAKESLKQPPSDTLHVKRSQKFYLQERD